jgi:UDP-glucose 4-epimerase
MDIRAPELRDAVVKFGPEVVFHMAAQIDVRKSVNDPAEDASINVVGTVNTLQAAVDGGAARFVFSSSGGATFGDVDVFPTPEKVARHPESPYGVAKKIVDDYFAYYRLAYGLDYVSLGYSNVYGPRQDPHGEAGVVAIFSQRLLGGQRCTIFGDGSQLRDYVYVEDVTDACVRAADRGGSRYLNIGTGRETSVIDLYGYIRDFVGSSLEPEFAPAKAGDIPRSCLDPSAAEADLDWQPWTSLESGLRQTVDWFRANPEW